MQLSLAYWPNLACLRHVIRGPPPLNQLWDCKELFTSDEAYQAWVAHLAPCFIEMLCCWCLAACGLKISRACFSFSAPLMFVFALAACHSKVECAKQQPEEEWAKSLTGLSSIPEFEPVRKVQQSLQDGFLKAMSNAMGQGGPGRVGWGLCIWKRQQINV